MAASLSGSVVTRRPPCLIHCADIGSHPHIVSDVQSV